MFLAPSTTGRIMKIRRDIVIAGTLGLFLAVTAHGGTGQTSILDSGPSTPAHSAVSTSFSHHKTGSRVTAHPAQHHRRKHRRAT
jgi:hypothetical protein